MHMPRSSLLDLSAAHDPEIRITSIVVDIDLSGVTTGTVFDMSACTPSF